MVKKKDISHSKEKTLLNEKNKTPKPLSPKKEKDFGGIPDIDPKRFLGCG